MFEDIKDDYNVVVAGMGPAGSSVARHCAEKGLKVLALEKRQEIGSPKRCGEGLSKSSFDAMGIKFDKSWALRTINGAVAYAPNGNNVVIDFHGPEGWVIERKMFDKFLAKQAAKAGAFVITKAEVTGAGRENGAMKVVIESEGRKKEVRCRMLVAADGVESRVARMLGINTTMNLNDIASGVQFEMTNIKMNSKMIELYFGTEIAPGGYVWIFPKGNTTANVGIGIRPSISKKPAINYLREFIEKNDGLRNGSILEVNSGGVPVGGFLKQMVDDNFLIVGDAAHQVNPIHGGGIKEAYVAGKIAADVIVDAMESNDFSRNNLSKYEKRWESERGNHLKNILKVRKVFEEMKDEDLNWISEYVSGDDLVDLARGSGLKKMAGFLMKKPRLIGLARKLL